MKRKICFLLLCLALLATVTTLAAAIDITPTQPLPPGQIPEDNDDLQIPEVPVYKPAEEPGADFFALKTDFDGNPLGGAVFSLTDENGVERYTATSDMTGKISFRNVADGDYTLQEKRAPSGYVTSSESYCLQITGAGTEDEQILINYEDDEALYEPITFVNYKQAYLNRTDHFAFLQGYPDGTFGPEKCITRAEATTMFARLLTETMDPDRSYPNTFSDVPTTHWAADYIGYMQQFGIIKGYDDGTFRPDGYITRAEFAAICCRFEKLSEGTVSFTDVPDTHWAANYIRFAATRGWATGYEDGTFKPNEFIIRSDVAATTCRLLERSADQDFIRAHFDELPQTFTDMTESHPDYWYVLEAANGHEYTKSGRDEIWSRVYL